MIKDGELIRISHKGSDFFTTDNEIISYKTEDIKENNLVVKSVVIRSSRITDEPITLIARCKEYETIALVSVIEEKIIYPKGGLEFFPKRKKIKPNSRTEIRLYFDLDFIPMGSNIEILQTYDARLLEDRYIVQIKPNNIISDNIGFLKIKINSDDLEDKISLSANCNDIRAEAVVYVRLKDDDKAGNSGFLKRIELRFEDDWWQTSLIDNKGVLYINGMHVINRNILGDLGQEDHNNPSFKKDQRKYLYELIAVESAKRIVSDLVERGQIRFDQPRALFDNFQEHKTMIYLEIAEM
jgi:hypothetical protein